MANTYITRTPSSAGNRRKFTISMWVKRVKLGVDQWLVQAGASGSEFDIRFTTSDQIRFSTWDGSNGYGMITTRVFRDVSAWYHLVFQYDTAQATDTNRNKIYVNGEQISPSDTSAYNAGKHPPQNYDNPSWNNTTAFRINDVTWTSSSPKDAVYSHIHHTDGYAYDASTFGSTDSTTGEWKINTSPSITMGTNGFTILKDGNTITDQSSNSNDFTLGAGQITNLKDNPSNNFCNINLLYNQTTGQGVVVNNCGNTVYYASNASRSCFGSIAPSSGKYYFEAKVFGGTGTVVIGIVNMAWSNLNGASGYAFHDDALNFGYNVSGQKTSGGSNTAYGSAISDGDIVGVAMDLDNSKLYFSLNGVFQGSGDPTSGASGTNAAFTLASGANYTGACRLRNGTQVGFNFGNGQYSGSSVVASEGTNASGNGKFEYDVPTGYTALSTKGLNL